MPEYHFQCNNKDCKVHRFASIYMWKSADGINVLDDPTMQECPECGEICEFEEGYLSNMRPDRFWAGFYDDRLDKYWTSESRFNQHLKDNELVFLGDRTDREGLTKWAENSMKEKDVKHERAVEKAIVETMAWQDEWGDYGTVKERNKKARERARLESECPADVFEDPAFK